jgi:hypothetical protein
LRGQNASSFRAKERVHRPAIRAIRKKRECATWQQAGSAFSRFAPSVLGGESQRAEISQSTEVDPPRF